MKVRRRHELSLHSISLAIFSLRTMDIYFKTIVADLLGINNSISLSPHCSFALHARAIGIQEDYCEDWQRRNRRRRKIRVRLSKEEKKDIKEEGEEK